MSNANKQPLKIPGCPQWDLTNLSALLPYWHIQDGIVHLKDGTYEIGFELKYTPASMLSMQGHERTFENLKNFIGFLASEQTRVRFIYEVWPASKPNLVEEYASNIKAPELLLQAFGQRRAAAIAALSEEKSFLDFRFYVTIKKRHKRGTPPSSNPAIVALSGLFPFLKKTVMVPFLPDEYLKFQRDIQLLKTRIQTAAAASGIKAVPLNDQQLFALIFRTLNPDKPVPQYQPPSNPFPLEKDFVQKAKLAMEQLGDNLRSRLVRTTIDNRDPAILKAGRMHHRLYQLVDMPMELTFGAIQRALMDVPPPHRAVIDLVPLPKEKARNMLTKRLGDAMSAQRMAEENDLGPSIEGEEAMAETQEMIRYMVRSGETIWKVSGLVTLMDENEDRLYSTHNTFLSSAARELTTPMLPLERGAFTPFLSSLPFAGTDIPYNKLYVAADATKFLSYITPLELVTPKPAEFYITTMQSPFAFNAFRAKGLYNANALVVGSSGSGKSFFVQLKLMEYLKDGETIAVVIDKDAFSYDGFYQLFAEEGLGVKLEFSVDSGVVLNPFDLPPGEVEPDDLKLAFLEALFTTLVPLDSDPATSATEVNLILAAIHQTYRRAQDEIINENGEPTLIYTGATMTDFVNSLANLNAVQGRTLSDREKELARSLATRFSRWTKGSPRGKLLDGKSTFQIKDNTRFIYLVVNQQDTDQDLLPVTMLLVADLAWRISLQSRYPKKIAVFEEAWAFMQNAQTLRFITEFFRAARKRNVSTIAISQSVADFAGEHASTFLNNVGHMVLFRTNDSLEELQAVLPQVPPELFSLTGGGKNYRRALYWLKDEANMGDIVLVETDPISYWTFTSNASDLVKRQKLQAELGSFSLAVLVLAGEITYDEAVQQARIDRLATEQSSS